MQKERPLRKGLRSRQQKKIETINNQVKISDQLKYNAFSAELEELENCNQDKWILDSCSSTHMTYDHQLLHNFQPMNGNDKVYN